MYVLTAAQMRQADRGAAARGLDQAILMENAGHRVVEFLERRFAPLAAGRIVVLCGKGNNGGDGVVVARQLHTRVRPRALHVVLAEQPANAAALASVGCPVHENITTEMRAATIVVDALLGTGLSGPPRGVYAGLIAEINEGFPAARVVAVDVPSGLASDHASTAWPHVRADYTVTFSAPKIGLVLYPNSEAAGELHLAAIGIPDELCASDLLWSGPADFAHLFRPRPPASHKGDFGHVLVAGGAPGKTGAAAMAAIAALRAGAGLVTVAAEAESLPLICAHAPELMSVAIESAPFDSIAAGKTVLAIGPGLGVSSAKTELLRKAIRNRGIPVIADADALNNLAGVELPRLDQLILTPHPGEMSRLTRLPVEEIQANRLEVARDFVTRHGVTVVLKGRDSLVAFPEGQVRINPTGTPALATAGSGDILTGLIAGLIAQFPSPEAWRAALCAAVWLHGRCGELAARRLGEKCVIATDLLAELPAAMEECARVRH